MRGPGRPRESTRRRALVLCGAGLPVAALACARPGPPDRRVRVTLASLGEEGRVEVTYAGEPAEVVRTASGVVARSLLKQASSLDALKAYIPLPDHPNTAADAKRSATAAR